MHQESKTVRPAAGIHAQAGIGYVSPLSEQWIALLLTTAVYALNVADRFLMSIFIQPIKSEFRLSDTSIGFLTGVVLAIFFAGSGIPFGIVADRSNRRNLLAICTAAFSVMTAFSGLARNFLTLAWTRVGVGIGESGCTPASLSLLADKFPPHRRATAMTIFALGASLGGWAGSSLGGSLGDLYGWRMAMILFGAIGAPVAALVWLGISEPVRGAFETGCLAEHTQAAHSSLLETLRFIAAHRVLLHIIIGSTVVTLWAWGLVWWIPAFLVRSYGMSLAGAGSSLGIVHGICGTITSLLTAAYMLRLGTQGLRKQIAFLAAATALCTVPSIIMCATSSRALAIGMLWLFLPGAYLYLGPSFALVNSLVPAPMRAKATAIYVFTANLANLAIAPQLVGIASDAVAAHIANPNASLRYVLIVFATTGFWGALHFSLAILHDLKNRPVTQGAQP